MFLEQSSQAAPYSSDVFASSLAIDDKNGAFYLGALGVAGTGASFNVFFGPTTATSASSLAQATLDDTTQNATPSLALDSQGGIHASYGSVDLTYAYACV